MKDRISVDQYTRMSHFYRGILKHRKHFENQSEVVDAIIQETFKSNNLSILDAACGTGDVVEILYNSGYKNISATDGSEEMIKFFSKDLIKKIQVQVCPWINLDDYFLKNNPFDLIYILGHSLPHACIDEIPRIFSYIYKGLKPNGIFLFDVRTWVKGEDQKLIQPGRPANVYRDLGIVTTEDGNYHIEDKVTYNDNIQHAVYRIRKLLSENPESNSEEILELNYSIFNVHEAISMLELAGFNPDKIQQLKFDNWSYIVIKCTK